MKFCGTKEIHEQYFYRCSKCIEHVMKLLLTVQYIDNILSIPKSDCLMLGVQIETVTFSVSSVISFHASFVKVLRCIMREIWLIYYIYAFTDIVKDRCFKLYKAKNVTNWKIEETI